jgi:phosphatidylglycerophosphatase A
MHKGVQEQSTGSGAGGGVPRAPKPAALLRSPFQMLAFGFGSGLSPRAPGTAGSVAALAPYLLLVQLPPWGYLLAVALAALAGVVICARASRELGVHDHPGIVWDEFVGQWLALAALPVEPLWIGLGFVAFRLLDIAKPWPIGWLDRRVGGGIGIMIDDIAAGALACGLLHMLHASGVLS